MLEVKDNSIPGLTGERKISLHIMPSFEYSVPGAAFELYKDGSMWKVYWSLCQLNGRMRKKVQNRMARNEDSKELFDELGFGVIAYDDEIMCFHELDADTVLKAEELCENGLPLRVRKQHGLDGVSYAATIDGFPDEYRFWSRCPAEWSYVKDILDVCISYARMNKSVYSCGKLRKLKPSTIEKLKKLGRI